MTRALFMVLLLTTGCTSVPSGAEAESAGGDASARSAPSAAVLTFTTDDAAAATGTVTLEAGGTVSASAADGTTFELLVPPEAVAGDTEITMTPLTDVTGIGDGAVHAVQLEPEGLEFYALVRLTITPAEPIPLADQLMFEAAGDGSDPGLALIDPTSEPIVLLLEHFSAGGVASVTAQQRATFILKTASNAERRISNEVGRLLGEERNAQLLGESDVEGMSDELLAEMERLFEEYQREVLDRRREAAMLSCTALKTYVTSVIGYERDRQLLGITEAGEAASHARVLAALEEMTARYKACEQEAIAACKEAKDPKILIEFWLAMGRQFGLAVGDSTAIKKRAEEICEPQGYQFEFSGSGTGTFQGQAIPVAWQFWGLLCADSEHWKIWELREGGGGSERTGGPGADPYGPVVATFGEDGVLTDASWPGAGELDPLSQAPPGITLTGTRWTLSPPEDPTEVRAVIPGGEDTITVTAPVEPADGTIAGCDDPAETEDE